MALGASGRLGLSIAWAERRKRREEVCCSPSSNRHPFSPNADTNREQETPVHTTTTHPRARARNEPSPLLTRVLPIPHTARGGERKQARELSLFPSLLPLLFCATLLLRHAAGPKARNSTPPQSRARQCASTPTRGASGRDLRGHRWPGAPLARRASLLPSRVASSLSLPFCSLRQTFSLRQPDAPAQPLLEDARRGNERSPPEEAQSEARARACEARAALSVCVGALSRRPAGGAFGSGSSRGLVSLALLIES